MSIDCIGYMLTILYTLVSKMSDLYISDTKIFDYTSSFDENFKFLVIVLLYNFFQT